MNMVILHFKGEGIFPEPNFNLLKCGKACLNLREEDFCLKHHENNPRVGHSNSEGRDFLVESTTVLPNGRHIFLVVITFGRLCSTQRENL